MGRLIVVTGANGFVGKRFVEYVSALGHPVRAVVRRRTAVTSLPACVEAIVVEDALNVRAWVPIIGGASVVVHLAGAAHNTVIRGSGDRLGLLLDASVSVTKALSAAVRDSGVERVVYVSSIKAIGDGSSTPYSEKTACQPPSLYGLSKLASEVALRRAAEDRFEYVILRPPLIYGPGVKGNFGRLLRLVETGIPLPFGSVANRRHMLYLESAVAAIALAVVSARAKDRVFLVADCESLSTPDLIRTLASGMDRRCRLISVPDIALKSAAAMCGRSRELQMLTGSLEVSSELIRGELGWSPAVTAADGLRATAKACRGASRS